ncbi:MAG: ribbon-helix-helix protein, CopG family, partial [Candidatus Lokiarchaeota archaeon]|nr:ribbon-helix-helix protein, CopG family [Candidatus Lokiarchaeota archaeon]MBD3338762.1 ribbon-helix-helix protein, CopG family [Candidatus Lokiarchaeota archaeon]
MEEKEEYQRFTISLPKDLYDRFEDFRKKLDASRSEAIRKAMTAYMISEENIPQLSGNVVGCITLILAHEHFNPNKDHSHEHSSVKNENVEHDHNHDHDHSDLKSHAHKHDKGYFHDHDYSSMPVYANVQQ